MPDGEDRVLAITAEQRLELEVSRGDPRLDFLADLVRYAYSRLGSLEEAEDVAIEVLQAATQVRGGLQSLQDPRLYLLGIARRKVADQYRKSRRQRGPGTLSLDDQSSVAAPSASTDISIEVRAILAKLPEIYQEVLVLKYIHELSAEEIAIVLRKSKASARSLVQRARDAFAREGGHLVEDNRA